MILSEGKTKRIKRGPSENTVVLETYDVLTGGDAAKREEIEGIGVQKTAQTANVFSLLNSHNIPTSYINRISDNEILCHQCEMVPLEVVIRRYAWGSYLLRNPKYKQENNVPFKFEKPVWELFHKYSVVAQPLTDNPYQVNEEDARKSFLRNGVWKKGVYTDPYIEAQEDAWYLFPQKKEIVDSDYLVKIPPIFTSQQLKEIIDTIVLPTFEILEKAWDGVVTNYGPVALVDLKIELGRRISDGKIVVADVIDNDSWRIWPGCDHTKQLDKQCFRDDYLLNQVAQNYEIVTYLTEKLISGN